MNIAFQKPDISLVGDSNCSSDKDKTEHCVVYWALICVTFDDTMVYA